LIVSNGVCSDTAAITLFFDNLLHAKFETSSIVCPGDKAVFVNNTVGNNITNWSWNFGNGNTSNIKNPPAQSYNVGTATYSAIVKLVVTNSYGCSDSTSQLIRIINNCYIAVPSAFTPNGDGFNDYLYPLNAYKAVNLSFSVYNRFGQKLFYTTDWLNKWDGTFKGQGVDQGTYVWILTYTNKDTNKRVEQKGTTVLIR
jgi:gliding motility-associated-like protein